jgi:hypothetical protein
MLVSQMIWIRFLHIFLQLRYGIPHIVGHLRHVNNKWFSPNWIVLLMLYGITDDHYCKIFI